jgi:hypothetical protein
VGRGSWTCVSSGSAASGRRCIKETWLPPLCPSLAGSGSKALSGNNRQHSAWKWSDHTRSSRGPTAGRTVPGPSSRPCVGPRGGDLPPDGPPRSWRPQPPSPNRSAASAHESPCYPGATGQRAPRWGSRGRLPASSAPQPGRRIGAAGGAPGSWPGSAPSAMGTG